ncbi:MAG: glucosyl-3-phosphoglycerate synthase [Nitriliruptoraceae bacterium]
MGDLLVLTHTPAAGLAAWRPLLLAGIAGPWRVRHVPTLKRLPSSLEDIAGLLVLGGTMSAVEPHRYPWMRAEQRLLAAAVAAEVPVFGVCLGAQLLAGALGGGVVRRSRSEVGVLGLTRTEAGRSDPLLGGWPDHQPALFVHEDEVAPLPAGATPLLTGSAGVPAWRLGSAVAVQFHPEVDPATLEVWIRDPVLGRVLADHDPRALLAAWQAAAPATVATGRDLLRRFIEGPVAARRRQRGQGPVRPSVTAGPPVRAHTRYTTAEVHARCRAAGHSVSVIIPARDEAATVGHVVEVIRRTLQEEVPLVDELLVVDSDSRDDTAEVARAAGARVVAQADVLPDLGTAPGKGEAMWKGLAATTGDLVVYLDADVTDVQPHFVVGLLGPLLAEPQIQLTKAVYDRRLALEQATQDVGGGRVTELLARPALTRWFPALAGLAQPLAGEVAARRSLLRDLPFVRGYGVEVGMLIDVVLRHGIEAIAQVDLGRRTHEHQDLAALGRMATELLEVIVGRRAALDTGGDRVPSDGSVLGERGEPEILAATPAEVVVHQPRRDGRGMVRLYPQIIRVEERPPLARLAAVMARPDR